VFPIENAIGFGADLDTDFDVDRVTLRHVPSVWSAGKRDAWFQIPGLRGLRWHREHRARTRRHGTQLSP
jgi:hypothetical protein